MTPLTRDYFETHGYRVEPCEVDSTPVWQVGLRKSINAGDRLCIDVCVTNMMYTERFALTGCLGNHCYVNTVMLYNVEDLEALYRVAHIRYDETENDFFPVYDYQCNKDIRV